MSNRKLFVICLILFFVSLTLIPQISNADPLDHWHWRNPLPQGNTLRGVAFGNGVYVAVGDYGTLLVSVDGNTWTEKDSTTRYNLYSVAFGNGIFVTVGEYGTILTSSDGELWTVRNTGTLYDIRRVTFCEGIFFTSRGISSSDGVNWIQTENYFLSMTYGNDTFVGISAGWGIMTSSDGNIWTATGTETYGLREIAYGNGVFVAVGVEVYRDVGKIATSLDGKLWESRIPPGTTYPSFESVAYGNGIFVAVGEHGAVYTSIDGILWTERSQWSSYWSYSVTYGNGAYIAVGEYGSILLSNDGITWDESSSFWLPLYGATYGNGKFVAVGDGGIILSSSDGMSWEVTYIGDPYCPISNVTYGNGLFVAVGGYWRANTTTILTSPDGVIWTEREPGTSEMLIGVAYGNGIFVAVGWINTILTSPDGIKWTIRSSGSWPYLADVAYGNGTFVAVGEIDMYGDNKGTILTSSDGITWTRRDSGTIVNYQGITYGNGLFVAVGEDGVILTSPDGVTWTERLFNNNPIFYDVAYGKGTFVAVGGNLGPPQLGRLFTSSDGIVWVERELGVYSWLSGITYGAGTFVAVGDGGSILQSDPVAKVELISAPDTPYGPPEGFEGVSYSFATGGGSSNFDDEIQYLFDWGDGTNSGWLPVGTNSALKSWVSSGTYNLRVQARCAIHTFVTSSWSGMLPVNIAPATPPSPLANVSASDGTYMDRTEVTWTASSGADSYTVYRATSLNSWAAKTPLGTASGTSFDDTAAVPKMTYYYYVKASNTYGTSNFSSYDAGYRSDGTPPAPINVSASDGAYMDRVEVTWTASPGATSYTVYRATKLRRWSRRAVLVGTTSGTSFDDTTAVPKTNYYYWVKASNTYGTSNFSAYDAGYRSDGSPPAPTNVSASDGTYTDRVEVSWTASSGVVPADSYTVYRATSLSRFARKTFLGTISGTSFDDTTAVPGTTYYYYVTASNTYGMSNFSAYDAGHR